MTTGLYSLKEVKKMIAEGKYLVLSADESLLQELPSGNWIGGTIPYFLGQNGGVYTKNEIFVTDFTSIGAKFTLQNYTADNLKNITKDRYSNGFTFLIVPAFADIHLSFALNSPDYEGLFDNPLIGLIAGVALDELNTKKAKTFFGQDTKPMGSEVQGVALHVQLPSDKVARLEIINIFSQNTEADELQFVETGFRHKTCLVNGKEENFINYLKNKQLDIKYPLVCNYAGAMVNVSFQQIDEVAGEVVLYAPVFKGMTYKVAKPVQNYVQEFTQRVSQKSADKAKMIYSCNCILNYVYGELEGKQIGFQAPTTFGEIAYQLLNQTFSYLVIEQAA